MLKVNRVGLVAIKLGMSQIFDESGNLIPVTVLYVKNNMIKRIEKINDMDSNVVVSFAYTKKAKEKAFRVSNTFLPEVGKELSVGHFLVEQQVDVKAITIGKGFAGVMKRHNFGGLEASHGVSVSHRSHGSTGQRQDPGKVFKGKKMAGHMGDTQVTVQNLSIVSIDTENSYIVVQGAVPGHKNSIVYISDAIKKSVPFNVPMPALYKESENAS